MAILAEIKWRRLLEMPLFNEEKLRGRNSLIGRRNEIEEVLSGVA